MKLKLLIVDDEPIICQGLKMTVPWDEFCVEVVGEAYDGEEALSILEETHVDIIITDVNMPVMDGLELAEKVAKRFQHIRMIIISGFDEFEYAKRAIRLGVSDYLLKPVDIDELMKLVKVIQKEMEKERDKTSIFSMKQLLSSIVMGQEVDINVNLKDNNFSGYQFLCSEIDDYDSTISQVNEDDRKLLKQRWKSKISEELRIKGLMSVSLFLDENRLLTCCKVMNDLSDFAELFYEVVERVSNQLGFSLSGCYSSLGKETHDILKSYQLVTEGIEIVHCIAEKVYHAKTLPTHVTDLEITRFEKCLSKMLSDEHPEIQKIIGDLFTHFEKNQMCLLNDVVNVLKKLEKKLFTNLPVYQYLRFSENVNITIYNSYKAIKCLFMKDIEDYIRFQSTTQGGQHWLIMKAVNYIKENYASDLKASEVANVINVSPNYFSQLIKQETGTHFNDYLHDVRLNQAKVLLKETPFRVFEIAEMVGYKDYKYFVHIFKKSTTITPTKYRKIVTDLSGES
ncbi:response regulator [Metabacillus sp. FJAT-53654]|uniref:Response regulator n=1 Tax=Metabacillus rhizosphaerae TaxID=3117747 RepID=A0ABZ2MRS1_9BACI